METENMLLKNLTRAIKKSLAKKNILAVYLEFCKKCRRQFYIKHHQQKIV
jgi:coproporphyrinogen III oxidase